MANNKVIYIPKGSVATYRNLEGNEVSIDLRPNREYRITLRPNEESAAPQEILTTISSIKREKTPEGSMKISCGIELHPGYMNVMTQSDREIDLADVCGIEMIHGCYVRENRSYKKGAYPRPNTEGYTFAFNTEKFSTPYKITAYRGEFISMIVAGASENDRHEAVYGTIDHVTDDAIYVDRYLSNKGIRTVVKDFEVRTSELLGLYRFNLSIEPFDPNARGKRRDEKAEKAEAIK